MTQQRSRVLTSFRTGDILTQVKGSRIDGGLARYTASFGVAGMPPLACFEADELESLSEAITVAMGVIDHHAGTSRLPSLARRWGVRLRSVEEGGDS